MPFQLSTMTILSLEYFLNAEDYLGCRDFFLEGKHVYEWVKVTQSCTTVCDPMDYSLLGSSVHVDSPGKNTGVGEDEMVGWHHRLDGHEFEQAPGVGDGQGNLACCDSWGLRVGHD